jgi:hypothetical protein
MTDSLESILAGIGAARICASEQKFLRRQAVETAARSLAGQRFASDWLIRDHEDIFRGLRARAGRKVPAGQVRRALLMLGSDELAASFSRLSVARRVAAHPHQLAHEILENLRAFDWQCLEGYAGGSCIGTEEEEEDEEQRNLGKEGNEELEQEPEIEEPAAEEASILCEVPREDDLTEDTGQLERRDQEDFYIGDWSADTATQTEPFAENVVGMTELEVIRLKMSFLETKVAFLASTGPLVDAFVQTEVTAGEGETKVCTRPRFRPTGMLASLRPTEGGETQTCFGLQNESLVSTGPLELGSTESFVGVLISAGTRGPRLRRRDFERRRLRTDGGHVKGDSSCSTVAGKVREPDSTGFTPRAHVLLERRGGGYTISTGKGYKAGLCTAREEEAARTTKEANEAIEEAKKHEEVARGGKEAIEEANKEEEAARMAKEAKKANDEAKKYEEAARKAKEDMEEAKKYEEAAREAMETIEEANKYEEAKKHEVVQRAEFGPKAAHRRVGGGGGGFGCGRGLGSALSGPALGPLCGLGADFTGLSGSWAGLGELHISDMGHIEQKEGLSPPAPAKGGTESWETYMHKRRRSRNQQVGCAGSGGSLRNDGLEALLDQWLRMAKKADPQAQKVIVESLIGFKAGVDPATLLILEKLISEIERHCL